MLMAVMPAVDLLILLRLVVQDLVDLSILLLTTCQVMELLVQMVVRVDAQT